MIFEDPWWLLFVGFVQVEIRTGMKSIIMIDKPIFFPPLQDNPR